ncbi:MAG: type II secretion system protein GspL [Pseudomonadales bacterium]
MNYFGLRFVPELDPRTTPCSWALLDPYGALLEEGEHLLFQLRERIEIDEDIRVIILVSGERVLTTEIDVAPHHARHIKKALPFMVEEQLAEDIDDVHLALPPNAGVGKNHISVVSHQELIHWLELLYSVDLEPYMIAPEFLFLPNPESDLRILFDQDRALIQYDQYAGTVVEQDNLDVYLQLYGQSVDKSEALQFSLMASDEDERGKEALTNFSESLKENEPDAVINTQIYRESVFSVLAVMAIKSMDQALNLLQGGYRVRTESQQTFMKWRPVAAVVALFVVCELALFVGSGMWFQSKASDVKADSVSLYRKLFPSERRVVNPKLQFQSHLNESQSTGFSKQFLGLLEIVASDLPAKDMRLQNLRFDAYDGGLMLQVDAKTIDQLENYKSALVESGVQVELLSAVEEDSGVIGRLKVEAI